MHLGCLHHGHVNHSHTHCVLVDLTALLLKENVAEGSSTAQEHDNIYISETKGDEVARMHSLECSGHFYLIMW